MKKLLILLFPTLLFANQVAFNHTHLGVGYSGQTKEISNLYNQNDLTASPTKRHHFSLSTLNNFTIQSGNITTANGMYKLGYDHIFSYTSTLFVFNQTFMNPVDQISLRNDVGIGMKTTLIKKQYMLFDLSAAPVFTYTKYQNYSIIKGGASFRIKLGIAPTETDSITLAHFYIIGGDYQTFNISQLSYYREIVENMFAGVDTLMTHESLTNNLYYNINASVGIKF